MAPSQSNTELRSISVPRIFLEIALDRLPAADFEKAVRIHDILCSPLTEGFQPALLNGIDLTIGPARMALELYDHFFEQGEKPFWFKQITDGLADFLGK